MAWGQCPVSTNIGTDRATTKPGAVTVINTHSHSDIYSGYPEELQAVYSQT